MMVMVGHLQNFMMFGHFCYLLCVLSGARIEVIFPRHVDFPLLEGLPWGFFLGEVWAHFF